MEYVLGKREPYCIFCPSDDDGSDEERLILYRGRLSMVLMNKYPYNSGHLLVCPLKHVSRLEDLDDETSFDLIRLVRACTVILNKVMNPEGFNIGLNLGASAGAGVEDHLHFHVVPRWPGDVNFITVFAEVRSIPEHIRQTRLRLLPHFQEEKAREMV